LLSQRSDTHYEEVTMSRIATITTVLVLAAAPAAFAGPVDLRAPDQQVPRSTVFTAPVAQVDLRTPDAVHGFVAPSVAAHSTTDSGNDISTWAILAIIAGAIGASALLAVMLRRHFQVGRPASV
jgi:hypothetical protein